MTGSFDGVGQGALVFRAIARNSPADDFSFFREEFTETLDLFKVDEGYLLRTETANLLSEEPTPRSSLSLLRFTVPTPRRGMFVIHVQKGTSSSGESSSLEISMDDPFLLDGATLGVSSPKGSSGSWMAVSPSAPREPPRPRN